jgi:hypothetical protein
LYKYIRLYELRRHWLDAVKFEKTLLLLLLLLLSSSLLLLLLLLSSAFSKPDLINAQRIDVWTWGSKCVIGLYVTAGLI